MGSIPWYLLPIPPADNTPPCDLRAPPDMLESAQAGEGAWMAQPVAAVVGVVS